MIPRSLKTFAVRGHDVMLLVRVMATCSDVDLAYRGGGKRRRSGDLVCAFFDPARSRGAAYTGSLTLPLDGDLDELVPHEVAHAVFYAAMGISASDDERAATTIGLLCTQIFRRMRPLVERHS